MNRKALEQAAEQAGIAVDYQNMQGETQPISSDTLERLLAALSKTSHAADASAPLPPVAVFHSDKIQKLPVTGAGKYDWKIQCEGGESLTGHVSGGASINLKGRLAEGYHSLTLTQRESQWHCQIIIAPPRCYQPPVLTKGKRLWGVCVQLYSLRSETNWGIGDYGDLRTMMLEIAQRGGDFVGVNPLHSLYAARPDFASPYSPSSRLWLNPVYIDVEAVADFSQSSSAQRWWRRKSTRQALEEARKCEWVDYPAVTRLKIHGLKLAWQHFSARDEADSRVKDFTDFTERCGENLYWQAVYDALYQVRIESNPDTEGWTDWPQQFQDIHSPGVATFCRKHKDEIRFWQWLQWLGYQQLHHCWTAGAEASMAIGLYRDLAVGVSSGGADTWRDRELFCLDASVGAPPDALGPQGQNWSLPPMDPQIMRERAYEPFIQLLRANMASCGALRIDHVMSLLRLWWIPRGEEAGSGAYVHYPVDDLLAILALESQRHRCMVIGEDLGTVPDEIVGKLHHAGVYSYKVLYFERKSNGGFRAPVSWQSQAIAVTSTHDLPTLRGYWQGGDLALGQELGIYPDKQALDMLYRERAQSRQALLDNLHRYGCVADRVGRNASKMAMTPALSRGMQRYVALSASRLMGLQPEDWLGMATPVNVPGTSNQYPNWRRKLTTSIKTMFADREVNRLLKDLTRFRRKKPV